MIHAKGQLKDIVVLRLEPGELIIESIIAACEERNIKGGAILSISGSMDGAKFFTVQPMPQLKAQFGYSEPEVLEGCVEMLAGCGTITCFENGKLNVHIHCSIGDGAGIAHGGHLIPGNKVLLTMEIVIGVFDGMDMTLKQCPILDAPVLVPSER